jgi:hypothetical protein
LDFTPCGHTTSKGLDRRMKTSTITKNISYGVLGLYTLYGIFAIPFAFFLISVAIGLIVFGISESVEITTATTILTGAISVLISKYNTGKKEGFSNDHGDMIAKRVEQIRRPQPKLPIGVYASGYVEGFEDISENVVPTATTTDKDQAKTTSAESKPAAATPATSTSTTATKPATTNTTPTTSNFSDVNGNASEGLFKLGVLPQETKGGFHIDQGTTVLNALNALQPDQVKKMSEDTQKLIDTQKSLMSMLGTMKPMLSDGKQLIDTFQQMFGPAGQGAPSSM